MQIENKSVSSLISYTRNARTHTDEQVMQVAASIREFGWTNPVLVDGDNGIIAGHGRVLAALKLGMEEIPTIELSYLSEAQKRAYILADNQLATNAAWDNDLLRIEIDDLKELDFDIDLIGFSDEELNALHADDVNDGLTDDDAVPDIPETPITIIGDVWILGNHRLMCGDSTSIDDVEKLMDGHKANMVFTDPPYGIEYQSNMRTKSVKFDVIKNDDNELDIAPIIDRFSNGWAFIWTTWKVVDKWLNKTAVLGYPSNMIVWAKGGGGIGDLKKTFITDYEIALVFNRGADLKGKRIGSVWSIGKDSAVEYKHPTQKPVALCAEGIDKTTLHSASVLDLFGGSGSTLIACEKTNRNCYMMELDEKYCDVIINRWQDFTGKSATLDGKIFAEVSDARS